MTCKTKIDNETLDQITRQKNKTATLQDNCSQFKFFGDHYSSWCDHPATSGSNPKHTIYAFSYYILYYIFEW